MSKLETTSPAPKTIDLAAFPERLLTIKEVSAMISKPVSSIYRDIAAGKFPRPVKGDRSARWVLSEIVEYIHGMRAERDGTSATQAA